MRTKGTVQQLIERRKRALRLLKQGRRLSDLAESLGVTPRSVQRWRYDEQHPRTRHKSKRSPGRPRRLTERQMKRLEKALLRGVYTYGYAEDYWTLGRIAHVIWKLFGVRYRPNSVRHVLQRMRWSCQKPQRVSFQHNEQEIARWKHYVWPRIKKMA